MIQALDSDIRMSSGTQHLEGNGSYIVRYFDDDDDDGGGGDDDDDNVKGDMIPVIKGATGTISKSFRKYLSNISGKHDIKEVQKKKNGCIGHHTHTYCRQH